MIDAAFQEVAHFPARMERLTREYGELGQFIETSAAEVERLSAERERMATENSVLRERIRSTREQSREFAAASAAVLRKVGATGT
jgi:predicted  nucleic acid-binding Zn-ribbon protein